MSLLSDLTQSKRSRSGSSQRKSRTHRNLKPLNQQTVVLVGASSGMGRATALAAAKRGARVVVAARNREGLDALVGEIEAAGGQALAIEADVSDFKQVEAIAEQTRERFGGFDTWVNFAATAIYAPLSDTDPEEFRRVIEVNLLGQAYGAIVALRHLRAKGRGALIFISSIEGEVSMPFHSAYAASKHGVNGMFDALRLELAHADSDVSVTCVMPTGVNTPFFTNARSKIGVKPRPPKPIYRPEHVADAVLFAAENPVRELFIGGAAKMFVLLKRIAPRLVDSYLLSSGFSGQRTRQPKAADAPTSMFTPETRDQRIEGDFTNISRHASFYTWLQIHPNTRRIVKAVAFLIGVGWLMEKLDLWDRADALSRAEKASRNAWRHFT